MALVNSLVGTILMVFGDKASGGFMGRLLFLAVSYSGHSKKKCRTLFCVPQFRIGVGVIIEDMLMPKT